MTGSVILVKSIISIVIDLYFPGEELAHSVNKDISKMPLIQGGASNDLTSKANIIEKSSTMCMMINQSGNSNNQDSSANQSNSRVTVNQSGYINQDGYD